MLLEETKRSLECYQLLLNSLEPPIDWFQLFEDVLLLLGRDLATQVYDTLLNDWVLPMSDDETNKIFKVISKTDYVKGPEDEALIHIPYQIKDATDELLTYFSTCRLNEPYYCTCDSFFNLCLLNIKYPKCQHIISCELFMLVGPSSTWPEPNIEFSVESEDEEANLEKEERVLDPDSPIDHDLSLSFLGY